MHQSELLKGNTETLLLVLMEAEPMYGYQLAKEVDQRSSGYFAFKEGTMYPALHRLVRRGWIRARWGTSEHNRRAKFYELTPRGRRQLVAETTNWDRLTEAIASILRPAAAEE